MQRQQGQIQKNILKGAKIIFKKTVIFHIVFHCFPDELKGRNYSKRRGFYIIHKFI